LVKAIHTSKKSWFIALGQQSNIPERVVRNDPEAAIVVILQKGRTGGLFRPAVGEMIG
jgi:hypothetical protein